VFIFIVNKLYTIDLTITIEEMAFNEKLTG